jgi:hypothetical protein
VSKENLGIFVIEDKKYPIKISVYNFVKSYLHDKEYVKWVESDQPDIKFGVQLDGVNETRIVCRRLKEMLNNSQIGKEVVSNLELESI